MTDLTKWAELNDKAKELFDQKRYQEAVDLLSKYPDLPPELCINLAKCFYYNRQARDAKWLLDRVIDHLGSSHELLIDKALYLNALGKHEQASEILKSLENQDDPKVKFNLGWHLLREDKFEEGFVGLQYGAECRAWGIEYQLVEQGILDKSKRWNGTDRGRCLYILEGGLGDQLIFLRWVNSMYKNHNMHTVVACDPSLMRLLRNAGYACIPYSQIKTYEYDFYVPAMSYPAIDKTIWAPKHPTDYVTFPYIKTHEDLYIHQLIFDAYPTQDLNPIRIGVKWFGNPQFEHDQMRTVPKQQLIDTTRRFGQLFSFQFEDDDQSMPNMKHIIRDWFDTYTAVASMDVIVTSCTSIAHLCGAMGKLCVVMVPLVPYFTWASDKDLWYEKVIVIRQTEYNDWSEAFEKLNDTLKRIKEDRL